MLSLLQDLFVRMLIIVGIYDLIIWRIVSQPFDNRVLFLFVPEMIAITISLWYDIDVRYKKSS